MPSAPRGVLECLLADWQRSCKLFRDAPLARYDSQTQPSLSFAPRRSTRPQDGPLPPQDAWNMPQDRPKTARAGRNMPEDGPKMSPRCPKRPQAARALQQAPLRPNASNNLQLSLFGPRVSQEDLREPSAPREATTRILRPAALHAAALATHLKPPRTRSAPTPP